MSKILYTDGKGKFAEQDWIRPQCGDDEIAVRAVMTGVCRSDIDMMVGDFGPLPIHMSGHEGLGQVIEVGKDVTMVNVGDYVATRGEPAYADEYNVRQGEFVLVPEAHPRYILEPVACGINVVTQELEQISKRCIKGSRLLILGSGFLAWVAYKTIKNLHLDIDIDVVGRSNKDTWGDILQEHPEGSYDVVIDLLGKPFTNVNNGALIVAGVARDISKKEDEELLWKACTTVRPSPRTPTFAYAMTYARDWIIDGRLEVDIFWTRGYNRTTEWQQAFEDALNRPAGYSRGYIYWDNN
jgi:threonine dehydrogenase-like Zn-dependent dehydrogenase